jgi:hypothetical protein
MMMKLMVASALSLVACGGGEPWDGGWGEPPKDGHAGSWTGTGGSGPVTGGTASDVEESGGESSGGSGGAATAGSSWGGAFPIGGESNEGGAETGGYAGTATGGYAGTATGGSGPIGGEGGASQAGAAGTGTGGNGPDLNCLAGVSRCFDAAANCFEFSPASDCDQIVDVCAAMQANCENPTP